MPSYMGLSSRSARIGRGAVAIPPATVGGVQAPHRELGGTVRHQSLDEMLAPGTLRRDRAAIHVYRPGESAPAETVEEQAAGILVLCLGFRW